MNMTLRGLTRQAAAALANLARDSTDNRVSIVSAGGIPPLLALMSSGSGGAKENTIEAIVQLANKSPSNQEAIAESGGIPLLVNSLTTAGASKENTSAITQCSLAASAIWRLSENHPRNKVAVAEAGAIGPLVAMLNNNSNEMCTNAAGALSTLSTENVDNQAAIARTGAIAPLCTLVREGSSETKEQSAAALWSLSLDNAPNKATIAKLGGIEPLVGLLVSGGTPKTCQNASGALASLASKHADNRTIIAKRLVGLLGGRGAERAVRVLGALSHLCFDHHTNQVAIAKAGGIAPVISWLSSMSEVAQTEAARALLAISADNLTTEALVVKYGAIPPLIQVVAKSPSEKAKEHAALTLWHLASLPENQIAISEAGGVQPLVGMLSASGVRAPELASVTIVRLATDSPEVSRQIAAVGGIAPLVHLLTHGSTYSQLQAAAALGELGLHSENRDAVAAAGAIPPLTKLLQVATKGTAELAARALGHLARDNTHEEMKVKRRRRKLTTAASAVTAVAAATAIAGDSFKAAAAQGGDVAPSNDEQGSGEASEAEPRRLSVEGSVGASEASETLPEANARAADVSEGSDEYEEDADDDTKVESVLKRVGEQQEALDSEAGRTRRPSSSLKRGVSTTDLLSQSFKRGASSGEASQGAEGAAEGGALASFKKTQKKPKSFKGPERRMAIRINGGIHKLILMLQGRHVGGMYTEVLHPGGAAGGWGKVKKAVDTTLFADENRRGEAVDAQMELPQVAGVDAIDMAEEAAAALCDLACVDSEMQSTIIEDGGVPPLLKLFHSDVERAQHVAAKCVWHLCASTDNQGALVTEGTISEFVNLLKNGSVPAQEFSAAGLCDLARGGVFDRLRAQNELATRRDAALAASKPHDVLVASRSDSPASSRASSPPRLSREDSSPFVRGQRLSPEGSPTASFRASHDEPEVQAPPAARPSMIATVSHVGTAPPPTRGSDAVGGAAGGAADGATRTSFKKKPKRTGGHDAEGGEGGASGGESPSVGEESEDEDEDGHADMIPGDDRLFGIAEAGGIMPLILLLSGGTPIAKEKAAGALWHLAIDPTNQGAIARANGIPPLVSLLDFDDGTEQTFTHAADALARLAVDDEENQAQISKRLVVLLSSDTVVAQVRAARALWCLASDQPNSPVVILNAGALLPLVKMLSSGAPEARKEAAGTLSTLAMNSQENQLAIAIGLVALLGSGDDEASEHVTELLLQLCADANNRGAIAKAGAIQKLVMQLRSKSTRAQELAAAALAQLTNDVTMGSKDNVAQCAEAGGVKPLVTLLESVREEAQTHAAAVLADMMRHSADNREAVFVGGGIEPLIALLDSPAAPAAAGALWSLSTAGEVKQTAIAEAGAVAPLVALLGNANAASLAKAAGALAGLSAGHAVNQDAVTAAGGLVPLVALLDETHFEALVNMDEGSTDEQLQLQEQVQANAASALAELARSHNVNQTAIAEAASIAPLIRLLAISADATTQANSGEPLADQPSQEEEARAEGARAIWYLAEGHFPNQQAVAHAGGVAPLVALLGSGSPLAQKNAAGALAAISTDNVDNEVAIATMLVDLLGGSGVPEKAARAISRLAGSSRSNQDAVARAGGIPLLVANLKAGVAAMAEFKLGSRASRESKEEEGSFSKSHESPPRSRRASASAPSPAAVRGGALVDVLTEALAPASEPSSPSTSCVSAVEGAPGSASPTTSALLSTSALREMAGALWSMSDGNAENQVEIAKAGGIPPLIMMIGKHPKLHRNAAGALWALGADATNQRLIADQGGIAPLVSLLTVRPSTGAQDTAAGALANLARTPDLREAIANANGVAPIVAVLDLGAPESKVQAAIALKTLVLRNEANQQVRHLAQSPILP